MLKDYYTNVYTAYLEFNTTFFTNHFLAHANQYVSKPEEIITKMYALEFIIDSIISKYM